MKKLRAPLRKRKMNPSKDKRVFEKKFFAIFLEMERSSYLSVQYAYNLEEAFNLAKIEYGNIKHAPATHNLAAELATARVGLFTAKTFAELNDPKKHILAPIKKDKPLPPPLPPIPRIPTQREKKNETMATIISLGDTKLLGIMKGEFTEAEIKYIKSEIKKLSTKKKKSVDK